MTYLRVPEKIIFLEICMILFWSSFSSLMFYQYDVCDVSKKLRTDENIQILSRSIKLLSLFTNFNTSILSTPHGHPNILLVLHASLFLYFCDIIFCYNTRKYRQFMHEPLPILLIINTII